MKTEQVNLLSNEDGILRIGISGRIDTNNAPLIEADLDEIITANEFDSLILDLADLDYISSVGIRILMKLFKTYNNMKIENTTPEVYEILEMTGITTVVPISKKMREFSVDGLEKIGAGFNGAVYRLDDETIIKVINEMSSLEEIQKERDTAQKAFLMGVPTAISFDVVKVGDNYGIIYELLNSQSYQSKLQENPDRLEEFGREFGALTRRVNDTIVEDESIDRVKEKVLKRVDKAKDYLSEEDFKLIRSLFEAIPETNNFVHGDFHPGNVLVQGDEPLLIDMATSGKGHPVFDLISFALPVIGSVDGHPDDFESIFTGLKKKQNFELWDAYLRAYFDTEDEEYLEKVKDELLLYTRALKTVNLFKYVESMKNQEQAAPREDQSDKVRNFGLKMLEDSISSGLQTIRDTVAKREKDFFF